MPTLEDMCALSVFSTSHVCVPLLIITCLPLLSAGVFQARIRAHSEEGIRIICPGIEYQSALVLANLIFVGALLRVFVMTAA